MLLPTCVWLELIHPLPCAHLLVSLIPYLREDALPCPLSHSQAEMLVVPLAHGVCSVTSGAGGSWNHRIMEWIGLDGKRLLNLPQFPLP